jgi:hypothetical protein
VVGVYSLLTTSTCSALGARNVFTKVAPFRDLLVEAFAAAGAEPVLEVVEEVPEPPAPTTDDPLGGSGSRDDPSCACSSGSRMPSVAWPLDAALCAGLAARRRARRPLSSARKRQRKSA